MHKYLCLPLVILFLSIMSCLHANNVSEVKSTVTDVTVYFYGAEITASAQVSLTAGTNTLLFRQLSPNLNPETIQVEAGGNVRILSVTHQVNYLDKLRKSEEIEQLRDEISHHHSETQKLRYDKSVYQEEKSLLLSNKSIGGEQHGVSVEALIKAADFYRSRLKDINDNLLAIESKESALNAEIHLLEQQLNMLTASLTKNPPFEIVINVDAQNTQTVPVSVTYLAGGAGWAPDYAIRANDLSSDVILEYRANVFNNTGIDWQNVRLTLTTSDPRESITVPDLTTWHLRYVPNFQRHTSGLGMEGRFNVMKAEQVAVSNQLNDFFSDRIEFDFIEITMTDLNVNFEVRDRYNIPANGRPYLVQMQEHKMHAEFSYKAIPKIDKDAFLVARLSGWKNLNIIDGNASVYFGGRYIGETMINTRFAGNTLNISMGKDRNIHITRIRHADRVQSRRIANQRIETFTYEITVRNDRNETVQIEVLDQIPVSGEEEVSVEILDISGAHLNQHNGMITWRLNLKPGQTENLMMSFSVRYPKDKPIPIERRRDKIFVPRL